MNQKLHLHNNSTHSSHLLQTPQSCMRIPHGIRNRVPHPRPPHPRPQQPRKLSSQCPLVSDEKIFRPAQSSHSIERPLAKKRFDFCKDKPICPITAKRGTMKRKRQVREAMACLDEGCSDDIFESTPLKRRRKVIQVKSVLHMFACLLHVPACRIDRR